MSIRKIIREILEKNIPHQATHTNVGYKVFNAIVDEINKFGYMKPTGEWVMKGPLEYQEYKVGDMNGEEMVYWGGSVNDTLKYNKGGLFDKFKEDNFSRIYKQFNK